MEMQSEVNDNVISTFIDEETVIIEESEVLQQNVTDEMKLTFHKDDSVDNEVSTPDTPTTDEGYTPDTPSSSTDQDITTPTDKPSTKAKGSMINFPDIFSSQILSFRGFGKKVKESPDDQSKSNDSFSSSQSALSDSADSEQMAVERKNLLGMTKLSIKGLIESSLAAGHTLDSDHEPLQQFFIIMESVLKHGLKSQNSFFGFGKSFWAPLESIEKICPGAAEINSSIKELPGIKSHIGRGRAWLRLALMQKKLADYIRVLIENKQILSEFYSMDALLMGEEALILTGHLVGLNCIDANLCMKGDDLDSQRSVIDYSLYMKDGNQTYIFPEEETTDNPKPESQEEHLKKLMNQKNYLEERNRFLETANAEIMKNLTSLESSNSKLITEFSATKIALDSMQESKKDLEEEKVILEKKHRKNLEEQKTNLDSERQSIAVTKTELEESCTKMRKQLKHETDLRMETEKELESQMSMKQELEVAMKLLEKDIYDKQDSLIILREQLDNVKAINIEVYKKLQDKSDLAELDSKKIEKLESTLRKSEEEILVLQEKLKETNRELVISHERTNRYQQNLDDTEKRRNVLETNLNIEREWRMALEGQVSKLSTQVSQYETELAMMKLLQQELADVTSDRDELRHTCLEQESTIGDLADSLGQSKQNFQDLRYVHKSLTEKTWEDDKEVKDCMQCQKPFSIARRKHHCRNCGQIFCNNCSDNVMVLASAAKPVRVCDACHTLLLERYSTDGVPAS